MLITSKSTVKKDFPLEALTKCRSSVNFIARKTEPNNVKRGLLKANKRRPTLFEVENPVKGTIYDTFDIRAFTLNTTVQTIEQGNLNAYVSLEANAKFINMSADIIDIDNQTVLAELPESQVQNNNYLELNNSFTLDGSVKPESVAAIVYANWTAADGSVAELSMLCDLNLMDQRLQYDHLRPSITDHGVVIGNPQPTAYDPMPRNNYNDHIVVALFRTPSDLTDVNYICGFGNRNSQPYIGIPAKGIFTMPSGYVPCLTGNYAPKAICLLGQRKGGGKQLADFVPEYNADQSLMQFSTNGSQLFYDMACSWNEEYREPAGWTPTEFDYELKLTLYFQKGTAAPTRFDVHISSVEGDDTAIEKIQPLYIMYGCLAADTLIQMADGSNKKISEIKIDDSVMGSDAQVWKVKNTWTGTEDILMCIRTVHGILRMTKNHPLVTDAGIKTARELTGEEYLLDANGEFVQIDGLYEEEYAGIVCNLDLYRDGSETAQQHLMLAGGIAVGDNVMQNHMEEILCAR